MKPFHRRRLVNFTVLLVSVCLLLVICRALETALRPVAIYTGLLLLLVLICLTLFNARKKLPFLPLVKTSTWLQAHIYVGLFSVVLFLVHTGFRIPLGVLEIILAAVFVIVSLSGIIGIFLSRWLPPLITLSGESIIYEQIPAFRHQIQKEAEELVMKSEREFESSSLSEFYVDVLRPYLRRKFSVFLIIGGARKHQRRVESQMKNLHRYLADIELPVLNQLRELVDIKRNLDYQYSAQRALKLWLFIHIPFTYSLLLLAVAHGLLALNFAGRF